VRSRVPYDFESAIKSAREPDACFYALVESDIVRAVAVCSGSERPLVCGVACAVDGGAQIETMLERIMEDGTISMDWNMMKKQARWYYCAKFLCEHFKNE